MESILIEHFESSLAVYVLGSWNRKSYIWTTVDRTECLVVIVFLGS